MEVSGNREGERNFFSPFSRSFDDGDQFSRHCLPCERDRCRVPAYGYCHECAEHLCEECLKSHRKPAPCRNHTITKPQDPLFTSKDMSEKCDQHIGKVIEYFCQMHKSLGCSTCMAKNHRICKKDFIPGVSKNYITSPEYESLLMSLEKILEDFKGFTESAKMNKTLIQENQDKVKADIHMFREKINLTLDRWEGLVSDEIEHLFSKENQVTESLLNQCKKTTRIIECQLDDLKKLQSGNKSDKMYIYAKRCKESIKEHLRHVKTLQQNAHVDIWTFRPNAAINSLLETGTSLGTLVIADEEAQTNIAADFQNERQNHMIYQTNSIQLSDSVDGYTSVKNVSGV
ncbi:transcription intermediary factor 1-alpha-like [Mercenaria mercenaria]|uniref:transcription intermediary factor 1-alpha-like n=1 Tax=Mercenaria mercenaria TaxID=6596 RepID=UPI00234F1A5D|nr:transcription intermediary factor 1-alpha-like [Mercenaria mercenaria]